jgi:hypothetical protein
MMSLWYIFIVVILWTIEMPTIAQCAPQPIVLAPPRQAPPGARPVLVRIQFQPLKLLEVDSVFGIVRIQGYFDQFWNDPRLSVNASSGEPPASTPASTLPTSAPTTTTVDNTNTNNNNDTTSTPVASTSTSASTSTTRTDTEPPMVIFYDHMERSTGRRYYLATTVPWVPDLTFSTASSRVNLAPYGDNDPHFANTFTRVYENGDVHMSMLVELVIPVHFAIEFFPFEVVQVRIRVESYGNTRNDIALVLTDNVIIDIEHTAAIPGYLIETNLTKEELVITNYTEGSYTALQMTLVLSGASDEVIATGITTTTVLILIGAVPLWYDTDFNAKLTIVATALLTAFALAFSFERPVSRQSLLIELFLLSHQLFLGAVGGVIFMSYMLKSVRKSLLPPGMSLQRQDVAMKEVTQRFARKKGKENEKFSLKDRRGSLTSNDSMSSMTNTMPDEKKQVALLSLIELGQRDEKASEFSAIRPWQLCSVLSYTMLWGINVLAFYLAGNHLQEKALSSVEIDPASRVLEREARDVFVVVWAVGAPLVLVFAIALACLWKRGGEGLIFCCARTMVRYCQFDDNDEDYEAELKTLEKYDASHRAGGQKDAVTDVKIVFDDDDDDDGGAGAAGGHEQTQDEESDEKATTRKSE